MFAELFVIMSLQKYIVYSENRNQKTEIRKQKSENRNQKTEIRKHIFFIAVGKNRRQ